MHASELIEPGHEKTGFLLMRKQVTAKLISAFVFATRIVQFLFFLNPKFQASSLGFCDCRCRFVSDMVGNPEARFSHVAAQFTNVLICAKFMYMHVHVATS